ncbi:MAG: fasciclin domain-containing protein [Gemmatimonadaceae bacterium]
MKNILRIAVAASVLAAPAALSAQAPTRNIVQTAIDAGSFTTLVAAVQAAGLAETLSGPGPFTVFAPSDAAFAKLPAGTVDALLKDKAKLASILTYHVVAGKVMAADVIKMKSGKPKTVNGQTIAIVVRDGKVFVDGAQVVTTDIVATNGVIHVIDAVVLPKSDKK